MVKKDNCDYRNFLITKIKAKGVKKIKGRKIELKLIKFLETLYKEKYTTCSKEDYQNRVKKKDRPKRSSDIYKNKKWLQLRDLVFKRDNYRCRGCGSVKNLRCHHEYYLCGRSLWQYPISALTTLCNNCHDQFHKKIKGKELVRKSTPEEVKEFNLRWKRNTKTKLKN